jgi:hypothetical protein
MPRGGLRKDLIACLRHGRGVLIIDIAAAIDDPGLFEPWFRGASWDGWRGVLRAAFCLPMTAAEVAFFRSVADRNPPARPVRELWCATGRRSGKDSIASLIAAHAAALFDQGDRLRPGERALVMCLACDRDQSRIVLDYTRSYFTDLDLLAGMVRRETVTGFELDNRVDVVIATNSFRATRGRTVLCAILDECAYWRSETSASPDIETYRALVPGTATLSGSMVIGISSPYRKAGLLYQKFKTHYGRDDGDVLVIRAPSILLNPMLDPRIVNEALDSDPAAAKAEWLAEFRDDIGGYASIELIEAAVDRGVTVRPPVKGLRYVSFCDPSGGARDSFTCAVAHAEGSVAVLDALIEIKAPLNPVTATEQVADLLKAYGLRETVSDKYAAGFATDAFAKNGIKLRHSERDRSALYVETLPLFTSGRVRLLESKRLTAQFASLERRTMPGGKDRIDHGVGGADDLSNSAAGALVHAVASKGAVMAMPLIFTSGGTRFGPIGGMTEPWSGGGPARCWERLMQEERGRGR